MGGSKRFVAAGLAVLVTVALPACAVRPPGSAVTTVASQAVAPAAEPSAAAPSAGPEASAPSAASTGSASTGSASAGPARPADALAGMQIAPQASERPSRGGALLRPTAAGPLSGRTIVVDPGHNGRSDPAINNKQVPQGGGATKPCNTTGTTTVDGTPEHTVNWSVGVRLVGLLRAKGAVVILTRPDESGVGPCVDERAEIANRNKADLVLSIHGDSAPAKARGFHVIVSSAMAGGSALEARSAKAAAVLVGELDKAALVPRSTYVGGGTGVAPRDDIAGLNLLTTTPGIMLEMGNLANASDWAALQPDSARERLAEAFAATAQRFLG